ncbi:MAG TPA: hypothetical protein VGA56_15385, partial [Opitutaceae bacterium]
NGLGFRISVHEDTDDDADVDSNDKWFHFAFDERWRMVATFREDDSDPKEQFVNHNAGADGLGGSSYIDLLAVRDKDANTAWTSASDGVLEERMCYCQNWRADVSAIVSSSGRMQEWVKYSAYGVPFGLPGGDTDSDGDCDGTDTTQVQNWIDAAQYHVRGDADLDGDVDADDKARIEALFEGITLGREHLGSIGNRVGAGGVEHDSAIPELRHIRRRVLHTGVGRWLTRDPLEYIEGLLLYQFVGGNPLVGLDPIGLYTYQECMAKAFQTRNEGLKECFKVMKTNLPTEVKLGKLASCLAGVSRRFAADAAACAFEFGLDPNEPIPITVPSPVPAPAPTPAATPLTNPAPAGTGPAPAGHALTPDAIIIIGACVAIVLAPEVVIIGCFIGAVAAY